MTTKPIHPHGRRSGPVRLDRLAKACLGPAVARQGFGSAEILTAWPEIVGPALAARSRPERIKWPRRSQGGAVAATLVVRAEGGDALELQHMRDEILGRLNTYLGWGAVGRLVVRQAPVADLGTETSLAAPSPTVSANLAAPRSEASGTAESLEAISDPGLRDALARLAVARADETDNSP